ncbi:PepSY domain-containing protein [Pseudomonas sp. ZM23]|uniref:PepSY domain-containing protein n=1 Tax=Pseudomonas triclosanedens TaxID=2961893 RepID=A0ABY6ZRW3_9PSED|nr:PepSY domain-containing protein [Pseudomonas triclosanedens]MCP8467166.1 PepSY domain-containing protein [Pseudomonas triclosanedens]MCP8472685.1 PepSY domain-containing protein [Pseudomonas triclosanedens]MCP8478116.1 PepSY domain-containing protein [Pseudomonas triclosanedens]WAI47526.1 PepSY domain-containing protein [Pseudomonas triclosanedens]
MKPLIMLTAATALLLGATTVLAHDIGPDEALRLRDAGTIRNFEELNRSALAKHPGGTVYDSELELEHGRYLYKVDVKDAQGVKWDVELDAVSGAIIKDRQDH